MKRRDFVGRTALAALAVPSIVRAQGGPVEGVQYRRLVKQAATPGGSRIDVVEFFSYECPFCNALEPSIEPWAHALPADVAFRRIPVPFLPNHENFQKIYFSLEALGAVDAVHGKVFHAVHVDHQRLESLPEITALVARNGVDATKFQSAFNSFGVQAKAKQAAQLTEDYGVDSVPSIGVQGRFFTSGQGTPGGAAMLPVVDFLVQRVRTKA